MAHLRMQAALGLDEVDALHLLIHCQQVEAPVPAPGPADAGDHSARRLARVLLELRAQLLTSSPPRLYGDVCSGARAQGIVSGSSKIDLLVRSSASSSSADSGEDTPRRMMALFAVRETRAPPGTIQS